MTPEFLLKNIPEKLESLELLGRPLIFGEVPVIAKDPNVSKPAGIKIDVYANKNREKEYQFYLDLCKNKPRRFHLKAQTKLNVELVCKLSKALPDALLEVVIESTGQKEDVKRCYEAICGSK